jgi:SNF2 family DNA or RNA helicase
MGGYENKQIIGYSNVDELMSLIQPYTLEVDKKVLKLQAKTYKVIYVTATPEQQRLFKKIETGVGDGPMIKVQNVLEKMLRLQQVIGGSEPMTFDVDGVLETTTVPLVKNPKLDALMEMIDDNREGTKFIIWARYIPEIELICTKLREKYGNASIVDYFGATSREDRGTAEDRYCRDTACRFFVGNPAAAGLGLTLISGENDAMVYYSGTFAYIDRAQSEDRAHRIGQTNPVVVVDFVMEGTLDETIQESIREKKDLDQYVKDEMNKGVSVVDLMRGKH